MGYTLPHSCDELLSLQYLQIDLATRRVIIQYSQPLFVIDIFIPSGEICVRIVRNSVVNRNTKRQLTCGVTSETSHFPMYIGSSSSPLALLAKCLSCDAQ